VENNYKSYEECYEVIDSVIKKFQKKWQLKAINWFDFEDVSQIVKLHIFNKWHLWNQEMALEPWVARVTTNQIRNIVRNNYTNYVKPCMQCKHNMGDNICSLTTNGTQNTTCDAYAKWSKQKKSGYGIKLPLPMENHTQEMDQHQDEVLDFDSSIKKLNSILKSSLSESYYMVYLMLFFEHKTEEEVAKFMGYKTNEKNRKAGYKQIKNIKKMLKEKAQLIIQENDIIL
jgi:RNA polymerase sigma factor (sigma-70 family)